MYTRVHTFKFQNKLAKSSIKETIRQISDTLFDKGLQMRFFVDVNDTTINLINVWDTEENSTVVHKKLYDYVKDMKDMGINMIINGGDTIATYSNKTNFSLMNQVDVE